MKLANTRSATAALVALVLLAGACSGNGSVSDPAATIEAYIADYNAGDLEAVMARFAEDAVITGHPLDARASGRDEIRSVHAHEVGGPGKYAISNVESFGNTVSWDHVWGGEDDGKVFEFCVDDLSATIDGGHITSWTWPITDFRCDD